MHSSPVFVCRCADHGGCAWHVAPRYVHSKSAAKNEGPNICHRYCSIYVYIHHLCLGVWGVVLVACVFVSVSGEGICSLSVCVCVWPVDLFIFVHVQMRCDHGRCARHVAPRYVCFEIGRAERPHSRRVDHKYHRLQLGERLSGPRPAVDHRVYLLGLHGMRIRGAHIGYTLYICVCIYMCVLCMYIYVCVCVCACICVCVFPYKYIHL